MKEFNCADVIMEERRKRGITQEEFAAHLGVVKATVSKWETGASYPDISMLPLMATFFDISIDTLMGYTPQMAEEKIEKLYQQLALEFTQKSFEEVIAECEGIIKKYYSCYSLLHRMAILYLNHAPLASTPERSQQILRDIVKLCERVTIQSKDRELVYGALNIQAMSYLSLNEGENVLKLLGESLTCPYPDKTLIAQAYQLLGNEEKAQEALQAILYMNLMEMFHTMIHTIQSNLSDIAIAEPVYLRAEMIADTFNMKHINANNCVMMYLFGAQMYQLGGFPEKAVELLNKYADVCINDFFPFAIKADGFFDKLDEFITENATATPRNDATIKNDMREQLDNPIFESLNENDEFKIIIKRINNFLKGK